MKWKLKKWCDKENHLLIKPANTSGPFALPRGKGRGTGNERARKETEECELSKWYCQKIRRAIWLWLMLQSRVMLRYF